MMDRKQILAIMDRLYSMTRVPMTLVSRETCETLYCRPSTESNLWPPELMRQELNQILDRHLPENVPFMKTVAFDIMLGAIMIDQDLFITLGPASSAPLDLEELNRAYISILGGEQMTRFRHLYETSRPVDAALFASQLSMMEQLLHGRYISPRDIMSENYAISPADVSAPDQELQPDTGSVSTPISSILFAEEEFTFAISTGSTEQLDALWDKPIPFLQDRCAHTPDTELYFSIPLLTLSCRAAIHGGCDPKSAFSLYNRYIVSLRQIHSSAENFTLLIKASYDFCELVRSRSLNDGRSQYCRTCEDYITRHLSEKISVADLAAACCVSECTIYNLFRNQYQTTVIEYINRERIRKARLLLESTNLSLADITQRVGFSSQSYFTKVFNSFENCTPGEYRALHKADV